MTLQKPLEALLRPPLEWFTSVSAFVVAGLVDYFPDWFLLPEQNVRELAIALIVLSCYRFNQGYRVYRYQRNLKKAILKSLRRKI